MKIKYHFCWCGAEWELWERTKNNVFIYRQDGRGWVDSLIYERTRTLQDLHTEATMLHWSYTDYKTYEDLIKDHFSKLL